MGADQFSHSSPARWRSGILFAIAGLAGMFQILLQLVGRFAKGRKAVSHSASSTAGPLLLVAGGTWGWGPGFRVEVGLTSKERFLTLSGRHQVGRFLS